MVKKSLFHTGEIYYQRKMGVEAKVATHAPNMILDYLTAQQRDFFSQLAQLFIATIDNNGQPWASILIGQVGFINVSDARKVAIKSQSFIYDPILKNLKINNVIGLLGLDFSNRRRNRMSAVIELRGDENIVIAVQQAFGNCPKYIQTRNITILAQNQDETQDTVLAERFETLDSALTDLITQADTFFIASHHSSPESQKVDISHRGGKAGFVGIEGNNTLVIDDYPGNNLYMTLGNLYLKPLAGLLFIDFKTGDIVQLACETEVHEAPPNSDIQYRQIRFRLQYGWIRRAVLRIESEFLQYSPFLDNIK